MIRRLEYLASADVLLAREVATLRVHLQLFFVRLFFITDGAGRFRADAAEIRASLYTHELQQVSKRDVASRLHELHRAGLIKLYAEGSVGYGRVADHFWRQRDKLRKVAHPDESPAVPGGLLFAEPEPPPVAASPPALVRKRPQAGVSVLPPPLTSLPVNLDQKPAEACLAELAPRYPRHDLRACLRDARRYVRKERGEEAEVTVGWFVTHWMPFAAEARHDAPSPAETPAQAATRATEAARWQQQQAAKLTALIAGPEPTKGTLDHAIWLEGRKSA